MFRRTILMILAVGICFSSSIYGQNSYGSSSSVDEIAKMISKLDGSYMSSDPNYKGMAIAGLNLAFFSYIFKRVAIDSRDKFFGPQLDELTTFSLKEITRDTKVVLRPAVLDLHKKQLRSFYERLSLIVSGNENLSRYNIAKAEKYAAKANLLEIKTTIAEAKYLLVSSSNYAQVPARLRVIGGTVLGASLLMIGSSAYYIINESQKKTVQISNLRVRLTRDMVYLLDNDPASIVLYILQLPAGVMRDTAYGILSEDEEMLRIVRTQVMAALSQRNIEISAIVLSAAIGTDTEKEKYLHQDLMEHLKGVSHTRPLDSIKGFYPRADFDSLYLE